MDETEDSLMDCSENRPEAPSELEIASSNQTFDKLKADTLRESRKRKGNAIEESNSPSAIDVSKPKLRKIERKFVPVLEKLPIDELMKTNIYSRFNQFIDDIMKNVDESILEKCDDISLSDEQIISKYQLQELCNEAAKLKSLGVMHMIPAERLVKLLSVLEGCIRRGNEISLFTDSNDCEMTMKTTVDRVLSAADASLTSMYIMTSTKMPKRVYLEDTVDNVVLFAKYQLLNTIDNICQVVGQKKKVDSRKQKSKRDEVREKIIVQLYNKMHELISLLAELMQLQTLNDTIVLNASSMGVASFFVDNVNELQLSCLKLVTTIFSRYENHRQLIFDDILSLLSRLPSNKRVLRSYRLLSDTEEYIQMLTALVLQLIQCVVILPENLANEKDQPSGTADSSNKMSVDKDVLIYNKYEMAKKTSKMFLKIFFDRWSKTNSEIDYRPLVENFIQDLLITVNKPEWPASELLLSLLGTALVKNFTDNSSDNSLRVSALDYIGIIATRLRKDLITSTCKLQAIDQLVNDIKSEEMKDDKDEIIPKLAITKFRNEEEERTHFLQPVLLDYLVVNDERDPTHKHARHFYIVQWYIDAMLEKDFIQKNISTNKKKVKKETKTKLQVSSNVQLNELYCSINERKKYYISKIRPFQDNLPVGIRVQVLQTYVDYKNAELIAQYLASKRTFSQSFDSFLKSILFVLHQTSRTLRAKAMKCLTMIVEVDPSLLARPDMQIGVRNSLLDHSISVREAAVDLIGKFLLNHPKLIDKYYNMLIERILDTGVSVRKRVIKILKDICIKYSCYHKIPEICTKMIQRINDEEGIQKLVTEVFHNIWFTPTSECQIPLLQRVMHIVRVVDSSKDTEWFEMLLINLFKPRSDRDDATKIVSEPPKSLLTACEEIIDCLIEYVLKLEEGGGEEGDGVKHLAACLLTIYLFAKFRPQLLVKHASTLESYLSYRSQENINFHFVSYVAQTLELVVPLIVHPSETFLAQLERDLIKLIIKSDRPVVSSCIASLSSTVNIVTRNYKLIKDCFDKVYWNLCCYKASIEKDISFPNIQKDKPLLRRSIFIIGLLIRYFDFTDQNVIGDLPVDIKDRVFTTLTFYLTLNDTNIQIITLMAIGFICIRHYNFMLTDNLKNFYKCKLIDQNAPLEMKIEILRNIEMYLLEEANRMVKQNEEWATRSKDESLKDMDDISSGMASTVIQLYLEEILKSFIHSSNLLRHATMRVVQLILQQGLIHPMKIIPYLICMSTDEEKIVSKKADKQLQDIEKKYPGFIQMKLQFGIRFSYQLQTILQNNHQIVRGFRVNGTGVYPSALNQFPYYILRNSKQKRRGIVLSILKQFDEEMKTTLSYMLYLADNLAYFPYEVQDEPLFLIHHIDTIISVSGMNLLDSFKEALIPLDKMVPVPQVSKDPLAFRNDDLNKSTVLDDDDDDEENENDILSRLPEDIKPFQNCIIAAQGCLLLLVLKQHLKKAYGISDSKILQYSPTEKTKIYEKIVTRKSDLIFNPKTVLNRLKHGSPPSVLDEKGRKDLVQQYLEFKQLMLKHDGDNENTSLLNERPQKRKLEKMSTSFEDSC